MMIAMAQVIEIIFYCWLVLLPNGDLYCECGPMPSSVKRPPVRRDFRAAPSRLTNPKAAK
jgi:hypothetical protein